MDKELIQNIVETGLLTSLILLIPSFLKSKTNPPSFWLHAATVAVCGGSAGVAFIGLITLIWF